MNIIMNPISHDMIVAYMAPDMTLIVMSEVMSEIKKRCTMLFCENLVTVLVDDV